MTVQQLIEQLKALPQNLTVEVYQYQHRALEEATEVFIGTYDADEDPHANPFGNRTDVVVIR